MIDIKLIRENPELVKENIKKKFQDHKLVLVDEVIELDKKNREAKLNGDNLRSERKRLSDEIGKLMKAGQKEEAGKIRQEVQSVNSAIEENEELEEKYTEEIRNRMIKYLISLMILFQLEKMIVKMLKLKDLVNQLFQLMKYLIMLIL